MRKSFFVLTIFLAGLVFVGTGFAADKILIVGTGDGVAVLEEIGKAFTAESGIDVSVPKSIGSGGGIKAVGGDKTPLGRVARGIKEKEKHFGLTYTPIFKVPTVFFVNSSVTIEGITAAQAVEIYEGKITNWKQVGGADQTMNVVRREDGDSSLNNLRKSFPGFKDLIIAEGVRLEEKTPDMVRVIKNWEGSIGFGPLDVAIANGLKVLNIDGKTPTDDGYPTLGTIALIYKEKNYSGNLKKFVEFATGKAAHDAIMKAGGIPIAK